MRVEAGGQVGCGAIEQVEQISTGMPRVIFVSFSSCLSPCSVGRGIYRIIGTFGLAERKRREEKTRVKKNFLLLFG